MKITQVLLVSLTLVFAASIGCGSDKDKGKKGGSDCSAVVDHMIGIFKKDKMFKKVLEKEGESGVKKEMMGKCKEATAEARKCMMAAKSVGDVETCAQKHKSSDKKKTGDKTKPAVKKKE